MIKDAIADITLQQVLTRPEDFEVIATMNLNGDYLSDALAAQVGGLVSHRVAILITTLAMQFLKQLTAPHQSMLVRIK